MIEIDFKLLLAQIASFLVALFILWKLFWGPLTRMIETRRGAIDKDIGDARRGREDADKLRREYEQQLLEIEGRAKSLLEAATADGKHAKDEILRAAHDQARAFLENAKQEIGAERELAMKQLRGETVDLAVLIAEKILRQQVDPLTRERMLEEFIEELKHD
jgi:F-type H+-transporting ATPase subunit b